MEWNVIFSNLCFFKVFFFFFLTTIITNDGNDEHVYNALCTNLYCVYFFQINSIETQLNLIQCICIQFKLHTMLFNIFYSNGTSFS
jgi:hypothetical protein